MKHSKTAINGQNLNFWTRTFGDKEFIKLLLKLFIPSALQSLIAIAVVYVDNFALAVLIPDKFEGNAAKEGLGLASPVINAAVLMTVGWIAGIGIMVSQYFGNKDIDKLKTCVAFRIWTAFLLQIPFVLIMALVPKQLIELSSGAPATNLSSELGVSYLFFTSFTFFPFAIAYALSFSLQETKRTFFSFIAAACGMATNCALDPLAILLSPDVETAVMFVALSTGFARIVQCLIILFYIIYKRDTYLWFFKSWAISKEQTKTILTNGLIVFINEFVFSIANMILVICLLSFNPNIHDSTTNLILIIQFTSVLWPGMASASSVLIGSELGNGNIPQAKRNADVLFVWGTLISASLGVVLFFIALFVNPILSPSASDETNLLSRNMQWVMAPIIATQGIFSIAYYAIRSGGSKIVIFTDGVVSLVWTIVMASITFTNTAKNWDPLLYVLLLESNQIIRLVISIFVYKYYKWARVLTKQEVKGLATLQESVPDAYVVGL